MNDAIQAWMDQASASPAVAGCGVRTGSTIRARSRRPEVPEAQLTKAIKELSDAAYFFQQNQFYAQRLRWTFESGQICAATARGGVLVVLVTVKGTANSPEIERLMAACPLLAAGAS